MPSQPRNQAELVRLAAERDEDAFADLFEPLGVRLLLFIRRRGQDLLGPDCDAEDLLQTALARVWGLLPEFEYRGPGEFYRWLTRIAGNTVSDRLKYLQSKGRRDVGHVESNPVLARDGAPAASTTVASRAARREQHERLGDAIAGLRDELREVVERRLLRGESLSETAQALEISKTATWNRLQEALGALRLDLDGGA